MPYIDPDDRPALERRDVGYRTPDYPGELNFQITLLLIEYVEANGLGYQAINDVLGALEGAKLEFYRRVAVPYEDRKIVLNTDVYPESMSPR